MGISESDIQTTSQSAAQILIGDSFLHRKAVLCKLLRMYLCLWAFEWATGGRVALSGPLSLRSAPFRLMQSGVAWDRDALRRPRQCLEGGSRLCEGGWGSEMGGRKEGRGKGGGKEWNVRTPHPPLSLETNWWWWFWLIAHICQASPPHLESNSFPSPRKTLLRLLPKLAGYFHTPFLLISVVRIPCSIS